LLLVLVLAFFAWFSLQLLSQNGRIFARLEAIEAAIGGSAETLVAGGELGAALGAGLGAGGLRVGVPAPGFSLPLNGWWSVCAGIVARVRCAAAVGLL
jgi:hypothetical protein